MHLLTFLCPPPLQPAFKQTLPVPSIPAGGRKVCLPEIAAIITLQWFLLSFKASFCSFTSSFLGFFSSWRDSSFILGGEGGGRKFLAFPSSQSGSFGLCWLNRKAVPAEISSFLSRCFKNKDLKRPTSRLFSRHLLRETYWIWKRNQAGLGRLKAWQKMLFWLSSRLFFWGGVNLYVV